MYLKLRLKFATVWNAINVLSSGFEIKKKKCELFIFIHVATNAMKFECKKENKEKKKKRIWDKNEMWII